MMSPVSSISKSACAGRCGCVRLARVVPEQSDVMQDYRKLRVVEAVGEDRTARRAGRPGWPVAMPCTRRDDWLRQARAGLHHLAALGEKQLVIVSLARRRGRILLQIVARAETLGRCRRSDKREPNSSFPTCSTRGPESSVRKLSSGQNDVRIASDRWSVEGAMPFASGAGESWCRPGSLRLT
jgi:hypothetical protein